MKIRILPLQPHCFAFGGFEVQMRSVLQAVRECDVDAQPMDVWSRDAAFDVLHVWGLDFANYPAVQWARRSGKRVVMTALLPYLSVGRQLRYLTSMLVGSVKLRRNLLSMVNVVVVVNDPQAEAAYRMFGVPREKLAIIPNIIEAPFFFAGEATASVVLESRNSYVLCAGNLCLRKNQLNLAKACCAVGCSLMLIGDVLAGEERYGEAVAEFIKGKTNIRWLPSMPPGSPDLVKAFQHCSAFALPSHAETQPISLLEAAAARKPLIISDKLYARQKYYRNARLVNPKSEKSIAQGLGSVLAEPSRYVPPRDVLEECRSQVVGAAYKRAYEIATAER